MLEHLCKFTQRLILTFSRQLAPDFPLAIDDAPARSAILDAFLRPLADRAQSSGARYADERTLLALRTYVCVIFATHLPSTFGTPRQHLQNPERKGWRP